jgi:hypothetical protein
MRIRGVDHKVATRRVDQFGRHMPAANSQFPIRARVAESNKKSLYNTESNRKNNQFA